MYSGYVKYLADYGVAYGRIKDHFAPNEAITRAEFVAMTVASSMSTATVPRRSWSGTRTSMR